MKFEIGQEVKKLVQRGCCMSGLMDDKTYIIQRRKVVDFNGRPYPVYLLDSGEVVDEIHIADKDSQVCFIVPRE